MSKQFKPGDRVFWNDPGGRVVHTVEKVQDTDYKQEVVMRCGDKYYIDEVAAAPDNTWMLDHPRCNK